MKTPKKYVTIKKIFNLSLFGNDNADNCFDTDKKLSFSREFITYQNNFLKGGGFSLHELLTLSCGVCLSKLKQSERRSVISFMMDNPRLINSLICILMNEKKIDIDKATSTFTKSLSIYLYENKIEQSLIYFMQQHFLRFQRIDPSRYENFELDKSEYSALISDYLKAQTNVT